MKILADSTVALRPSEARTLASLLGQYQDLLESAIECELIQFVSGKPVDPKDPEIRARLQRDRRRWKKCEAMQTLLVPETCDRCANALAARRALPYDAMGSAPAIACTKCGGPR